MNCFHGYSGIDLEFLPKSFFNRVFYFNFIPFIDLEARGMNNGKIFSISGLAILLALNGCGMNNASETINNQTKTDEKKQEIKNDSIEVFEIRRGNKMTVGDYQKYSDSVFCYNKLFSALPKFSSYDFNVELFDKDQEIFTAKYLINESADFNVDFIAPQSIMNCEKSVAINSHFKLIINKSEFILDEYLMKNNLFNKCYNYIASKCYKVVTDNTTYFIVYLMKQEHNNRYTEYFTFVFVVNDDKIDMINS